MKYCQALIVLALLSGGHVSAEPGSVGVMADVGVPDGATASLVVRAVPMVKLHGGVGYNLIAPGVRVGVSFTPIDWYVSPSLNVEGGHYFRGDANKTVNMLGLAGEEESDSPVLREVGYDYANFHLGLSFGGDRARFYLHGGMSAIRGTIRNLGEALTDEQDDGSRIEIREDPIVTVWAPSARTGIMIFF